MILLHLGVEPVLEGIHLVKEDDLKKIHLLHYHDLVDAQAVFVTNTVS